MSQLNRFHFVLIAVVVLLVGYIFVSHSSSRQAIHDEIKSACNSVLAGNKSQVVTDFSDVAARDPGYLPASYGAILWASGDKPPWNFLGEGENVEAQHDYKSFFSLCPDSLNPGGWK